MSLSIESMLFCQTNFSLSTCPFHGPQNSIDSYIERRQTKVRRTFLLITQRLQRIYFRCPSRRYVASNQGNESEHYGCNNKRQRIRFSYSKQQTLHQSQQEKSGSQT